MTKKIKLAEAARDLKIENQEIIDLMEKYDGTKRKNTTSLSAEELNYILEHYSQNNQVKDFNAYFESKNKLIEEKPAEEVKKLKSVLSIAPACSASSPLGGGASGGSAERTKEYKGDVTHEDRFSGPGRYGSAHGEKPAEKERLRGSGLRRGQGPAGGVCRRRRYAGQRPAGYL